MEEKVKTTEAKSDRDTNDRPVAKSLRTFAFAIENKNNGDREKALES